MSLRLPLEASGEDSEGRPFSQMGQTVNISGGGICFESARQLPVGTRLTLRIELPPALKARFGGRSVYHVNAVVRRLENFAGEALSRIGARFLGEVKPSR
jgi:hypothetical protein